MAPWLIKRYARVAIGTSDEHISLLENLRPLLIPRTLDSPRLPTLSSLLVSTPQALALLDVSKELTFVRRTNLPLLGLIENMSGYVCPHCSDIVGVFGQGGGEDFCRREEERKDSTVEGEGGGCRFLGRIPIDRELVALLDDVADVRVITPEEAFAAMDVRDDQEDVAMGSDAAATTTTTAAAAPAATTTTTPRTLIERYASIPSFPIVKELATKVMGLIAEQEVAEAAARRAAA